MAGSGEESAGGGDKLAIVDHALEGFAHAVVLLEAEACESAGVQWSIAFTEGSQELLALFGEGDGILLFEGVFVVAEPEECGMLVCVGVDAGGEGGWSGTEVVFCAV